MMPESEHIGRWVLQVLLEFRMRGVFVLTFLAALVPVGAMRLFLRDSAKSGCEYKGGKFS